MQSIIVTAGDAAEDLKRVEGHGSGVMRVDQLPEILLAAFETAQSRLPCLSRLPLKKTQHPTAILAGLHTRAEKTVVALGQTFGLHRQRADQSRLLARFDFKFDQLGETAVVHEKPPLIVRRVLRLEGLQGKTSS